MIEMKVLTKKNFCLHFYSIPQRKQLVFILQRLKPILRKNIHPFVLSPIYKHNVRGIVIQNIFIPNQHLFDYSYTFHYPNKLYVIDFKSILAYISLRWEMFNTCQVQSKSMCASTEIEQCILCVLIVCTHEMQ